MKLNKDDISKVKRSLKQLHFYRTCWNVQKWYLKIKLWIYKTKTVYAQLQPKVQKNQEDKWKGW